MLRVRVRFRELTCVSKMRRNVNGVFAFNNIPRGYTSYLTGNISKIDTFSFPMNCAEFSAASSVMMVRVIS